MIQDLDNGKRAEISTVDGLEIPVAGGGCEGTYTNPITNVKFKTKLTQKEKDYICLSIRCGGMYQICNMARLMNELDITFSKAAKKYLLSIK